MGRLFRAKVVENTCLSQTHNILKIAPSQSHIMPAPGQFYLLRTSDTLDPLLRRPFSILRWSDASLEFLVRLKGRGTLLLRKLRAGEDTDLIGPLGSGYPRPSDTEAPVVVAGGVGIASVYSLLETLGASAHLFYGARTSGELYLLDEIRRLTDNIHISTDDGSMGFSGSVLEELVEFLDETSIVKPVVYACGPEGMIERLVLLLKGRNIPGYISLEERMACGIGACLGCVIRTRSGYKRVCKEGPVFDVKEFE